MSVRQSDNWDLSPDEDFAPTFATIKNTITERLLAGPVVTVTGIAIDTDRSKVAFLGPGRRPDIEDYISGKISRPQLDRGIDNAANDKANAYVVKAVIDNFDKGEIDSAKMTKGYHLFDQLLSSGTVMTIIGFDDILECEVVASGKTVTKTSRTSQIAGAAIGAIIAGGVGAIIGGLSGTKATEPALDGICLRVLINDMENPVHLVDFMGETDGRSPSPDEAYLAATDWHAKLRIIMEQTDKQPAAFSVADEIAKLADLRKKGIITDQEFSDLKAKLIS